MERLARKLGLRTDPTIFFVSAGIMVVFLVALLVAPGPIEAAFGAGRSWIVTNLGWFFIFGVTSWVAFLLWVAISRFGAIRLGGNDAKPDYSDISWFTMLFAGGIGTVLMFWGVSEGVLAAMLIVLAGEAGLTALQQVITVVGLPMFILVFGMMFALLRGLSHEDLSEVKVGKPPRVDEL